MNKQALFCALKGWGIDDLVAKFGLSREDAKRIVWAAYGKGSRRDARRAGTVDLDADSKGPSHANSEAREVAPVSTV